MDPNRTLCDLVDAATCGDADETERLAADLVEWLRRGGFAPDPDALLDTLKRGEITMLASPEGA